MVCPCERDVIFLVNRDLHVEGLGKSSPAACAGSKDLRFYRLEEIYCKL